MLTLSQHFQNLATKCNDSRSIQDKDAQSFKLSEMLAEERESIKAKGSYKCCRDT